MGVLAELFVATHTEALERAEVLESGAVPVSVPHVELTELTPDDLESLGEVAARVVRYGTGDLEVSEVDLAHDSLFRLSPFMADVLVELAGTEDEDAPGDVAAEWSRAMAEEADGDGDVLPPEDLVPVVRAITELAATAQEGGRDLYLWVRPV